MRSARIHQHRAQGRPAAIDAALFREFENRDHVVSSAASSLRRSPVSGIGYLMIVASSRFEVLLVFAGLTTAVMSVTMHTIATIIEGRTTGWATRSQNDSARHRGIDANRKHARLSSWPGLSWPSRLERSALRDHRVKPGDDRRWAR